ncbi:hypothetical protein P692DRAFT_201811134 [Suillus brevipes Sb2]|nr:hypothetical protein P692DRAFT_201811134 [Suillus brevipes Sb2]
MNRVFSEWKITLGASMGYARSGAEGGTVELPGTQAAWHETRGGPAAIRTTLPPPPTKAPTPTVISPYTVSVDGRNYNAYYTTGSPSDVGVLVVFNRGSVVVVVCLLSGRVGVGDVGGFVGLVDFVAVEVLVAPALGAAP